MVATTISLFADFGTSAIDPFGLHLSFLRLLFLFIRIVTSLALTQILSTSSEGDPASRQSDKLYILCVLFAIVGNIHTDLIVIFYWH